MIAAARVARRRSVMAVCVATLAPLLLYAIGINTVTVTAIDAQADQGR